MKFSSDLLRSCGECEKLAFEKSLKLLSVDYVRNPAGNKFLFNQTLDFSIESVFLHRIVVAVLENQVCRTSALGSGGSFVDLDKIVEAYLTASYQFDSILYPERIVAFDRAAVFVTLAEKLAHRRGNENAFVKHLRRNL